MADIAQTTLLAMTSLAMLSQVVAATSSLFVVKKFEAQFKVLRYFCMFDVRNRVSHRMWFSLLALVVSFSYLSCGAELFIKVLNANNGLNILKYILTNAAVGIMIIQYNYFILKDRRE